VKYDPATEILVTVGVSEGLDLSLRALLDPGDGVIIPEPCYVAYRPNTELVGGTPITVCTREEDGFRVSAAAIEEAAKEAKVLLLGYPSNPTGAVMGREDLAAIAEVAEAHDLVVIADELYAELTYGGEHVSFASMPGMRERTVLLCGFSKGFAMTGWRLGFAAGPAEVIENLTKIHGYTMLSAPGIAQKAAVESLRYGRKDVAQMRREYDQRRHVTLKRLREMGLPCFEPRGAFYVFPSIRPAGLSSTEFAERLLREEKVAVVPGNAFGAGGEGHVRICYATAMDQLEEALARMARFVGRQR
jgi:aminotransferase